MACWAWPWPPDSPANPWVYVLYTYDAPPGGTAPVYNDACPVDGACIVTGRLSRLQASGNVMTGTEQVLLTDWCQQFSSHSIGDLAFAPDGALYVTGGDGASFNVVDHGQLNGGSNPCSDPPSEGGALRSQDVRSTVDPTSLDGALLRLDPATGAAMAGNPNIASADANTRRIVGYGLRNPYRMTIRPGTSEAWIADTGWTTWEEVNRAPNPAGEVVNFGWPCYEGSPRQSGYDNANIPLCESLYTGTAPIAPYKAWNHASKVVTGETCPTGSSSSTGVAFYPGTGPYPADYRGALFFADYSRDCIWVMKPATPGGLPDAAATATFVAGAANPVDLAIGPGAELYYVDLGGSVRRIRYFPGNQPPTAAITTDTTSGPTPLLVRFDGRASTDPDAADQGRLTYAWDFTNDGTTDSTAPNPTFTYSTQGRHTARLTVTDTLGATGTETVEVLAGLGAPTAIIDTPSAGTTWATGQTISFSGRATDPEDGTLAPSRLTWQVVLQHCSIINSTNCHAHVQQEITGATGSFVAPDHEYPSYLELRLIATDSDGTTNAQTVRLDPRTVNVTFAASQPGLNLTVGSFSAAAPYTLTLIQGSTHTVSASSPQSVGATSYTFTGWSDGGARTHEIVAPTAPTTLTATYAAATTINLALNKPATSSTPCGASEGPAKAVNGTVTGGSTDKWCSAVSGSKWLQVDLGAVHDLSSIVVSHAGAGGEPDVWNTRDFVLDVSTDGTTWTPVATVTGNTANVTTHPVAVSGRYVRLRITAPVSTGSAVARIYELVVNGSSVGAPPPPPPPPPPVPTNLALNKPATSSTPCATAEGPAKAVNGSVTGGSTDKWCSAVADKWLRVDLGATYNVTTRRRPPRRRR